MIPAVKIDILQPLPVSATGGRASRPGEGLPQAPPGRALATQRDTLFFRSEAILCLGGSAHAPYLAQQIGQLWPSAPQPTAKSAMQSYHRSSVLLEHTAHRASLLA